MFLLQDGKVKTPTVRGVVFVGVVSPDTMPACTGIGVNVYESGLRSSTSEDNIACQTDYITTC